MSALPTVTITEVEQDNWQRTQRFRFKIAFNNAVYPVGGIPILAALSAALLPTSNHTPRRLIAVSEAGSGYTYNYIKATGCLMVLQVPIAGSLSGSGAPLQQLGSNSNSMSGVAADSIRVVVEYTRNA